MFLANFIYILSTVISFSNSLSEKQPRALYLQLFAVLLEYSNFSRLLRNLFESPAKAEKVMASEDNGGAGDEAKMPESPVSAPGSPRSKVKFLCSHGGKILPRPADGQLKYVGGKTRVVSVPRHIKFSELTKKLTSLFDRDVVLKYQLVPEDLDALVSVKSDEDLRHMLDEYDRHKTAGTARLRAFLFPVCSTVIESNTYPMDPNALEQRYIDAINGIIRATMSVKPTLNHPNLSPYSISSAGSSPKSPESCALDLLSHESMTHMHKVQSSPSLCSLNTPNNNAQHVHHHFYQNYRRHPHHRLPIRTPPELHKGAVPVRLVSVKSVGRADSWRYQVGHSQNHYHFPSPHNRGNGCCCNKCLYSDESYGHAERRFDRAEGFSKSPP